ncbi:hypothetical protein BHE74_00007893 [Ensete ventricosum]|nr:hypothetical protein GW17_00022448 [Ensete ventricosum]RWW83595.1 hypothetical protein BHE74_00007893 [Ensete ventricosum]RZR84887.1 hypothetical protein BHM03_00011778 [Ensete ventricosum]
MSAVFIDPIGLLLDRCNAFVQIGVNDKNDPTIIICLLQDVAFRKYYRSMAMHNYCTLTAEMVVLI